MLDDKYEDLRRTKTIMQQMGNFRARSQSIMLELLHKHDG